jgi:thiamine-monophosphate kinase
MKMRDENAVTEWLRRSSAIPRASQLVQGIGDDCAIFRPKGSAEDLLFTTDLLIEDVHFTGRTCTPAQAGRKALARSLSDIAAMGGQPHFCLVSLAVTDPKWVPPFFRGLLKLAEETGTVLAGGDLSHSEKIVCDVMVAGAVPRGKALLRSGARAGDEIYVSGRLGGSALGLATKAGAAWQRHLRPQPRLALGRFLREKLRVTSAMDLSDGLSCDLARLACASELAAEIGEPPRFPRASLEQALHGGEDYELLFTVRPGTRVPASACGVPLTRLGRMRRGTPGQVFRDGNPLPVLGYDHFTGR